MTAVFRTIAELRATLESARRAGRRIGLVPTMGALHEGHLALLRAAQGECDLILATIFVNPTQFGPAEDFAAYPRNEAADLAKLESVGTDLLFAPSPGEIYPEGFATSVKVTGLTQGLCGPYRPGHFEGVATVVTKLLTIARPHAAFFGEKDFQQLQVIRRLAQDLDLEVAIRGVATLREADGLAMSSRNRYLTPAERAQAAALPQALSAGAQQLRTGSAPGIVLDEIRAKLAAAGFARIDYVSLADAATLGESAGRDGRPARLFAAAWLGRTRLIDNWPV